MVRNRYFDWVKEVREIQGKPSGPDDGEDFIAMCNDVSWFGCYDDGMTPREAVDEFNRKTKN